MGRGRTAAARSASVPNGRGRAAPRGGRRRAFTVRGDGSRSALRRRLDEAGGVALQERTAETALADSPPLTGAGQSDPAPVLARK
eukprot:6946900-Alexandrium_andersonii.AAC.1